MSRSDVPTARPGGAADATIPAGVDSEPGPAPVPTPFRQLDAGRFTLGVEIARGGMGRVLRAWDGDLQRTVAIKELLSDDSALRARFEREALITAGLQHPGIVNIIEAGRLPDGKPFYAMKLVTGRPLDLVVAEAKTLRERLAFLPNAITVVEALAYAHSKRVIHRDLKPANVLLGEFGETVVIDWGLAKDLARPAGDAALAVSRTVPGNVAAMTPASEPIRGGSDRGAPGLAASSDETVVGSVMGTPTYMPPEQAAGRAVDERADVYALGALLYQIVAGRPPYAGKTPDDILGAVLAGPPVPLARLEPQAPRDLLAIVEKAMAREPSARYPDAGALAVDLQRFQTGQLVAVHRYTTWQLLRRFVRRQLAVLSVVAAAIVVLATVGTVAFVKTYRAKQRAVAAERTAEQAMHAADTARQAAVRTTAELEQEEGRKALEAARRQSGEGSLFQQSLPLTPAQNFARAFELLTRSCAADNAQGCLSLATMYDYGEGHAGDAATALTLYRKACRGGVSHACVDLGQDYEEGDGVAADPAKAFSLYDRTCHGGDPAGCTHLAYLYQRGLGVARDDARAAALNRKGCDGGDADGCIDLGVFYQRGIGVPRDPMKAMGLYRRACDGGVPTACNDLGTLYREGSVVARDDGKAFTYYKRACDGGDPEACSNLGRMYSSATGVPRDYGKAAALYRTACDQGAPIGCYNLGLSYAEGRGVTQDATTAAALFQKACDGGRLDACVDLGDLYQQGRGVPVDISRAKALWARACHGGDQDGCGR